MNRLTLALLCAASLSVAACSESGSTSSSQASNPTNPADASPHAPTSWLLDTEPANAVSVTDVKATAKAGDNVAVRARIGGRMEPISGDSPVFTVMDLSVPHCGEMEGDQCKTPWDYCCETPENIKVNAATIQVVDSEGSPITTSLTAAGLSTLDEVIIVGEVGPRPSPEVLTIRAEGVYRSGE